MNTRRAQKAPADCGFIADLLGAQFGCFLFQLPPSFKYSRPALDRILKQLDPGRRNVIEFRHASWWNDKVFNALRENNAIFCSISAPRLPDELVRTADDVYVRFHGTQRWYRHDYSAEELAAWARRIREVAPDRRGRISTTIARLTRSATRPSFSGS